MSRNYQICNCCIMDTSDKDIIFNEEGRCNHCIEAEKLIEKTKNKKKEFKKIISKIKEEEKDKKYDCIMGISGGVDSAYVAYLASKLKLRVLAVHVDAGWNTEIAERNIANMCKKLDIDLERITIDWDTMKELQRAYMFSGLANLDVPQDHVFLAGVYKYAKKYNIKYMLNGSNVATEGILPKSWGYAAIDYKNIKSVYKNNGRGKSLTKYPHFGILEYVYLQQKIKRINILNYINYSKKEAMKVLKEEFDWKYYGGKHYESILTRFLQTYYLPKKFGYDKKRAHLSSLIANKEITREEALKLFEDKTIYSDSQMLKDRDYILNKLEITLEEWENIMKSENKTENDYKRSKFLLSLCLKVKNIGRGIKR